MIYDPACPCGSSKLYDACCGVYIDKGVAAETAERLMRSRYCAYVYGREEHLLRTWHATTRPARLGLADAGTVKWLGLAIVGAQGGGAGDDAGTVEFVARYKIHGKAERLHEVSRFVREDGRWFYLDGGTEPSRR